MTRLARDTPPAHNPRIMHLALLVAAFVFILMDDMGFADLGCQGAKDIRTQSPHQPKEHHGDHRGRQGSDEQTQRADAFALKGFGGLQDAEQIQRCARSHPLKGVAVAVDGLLQSVAEGEAAHAVTGPAGTAVLFDTAGVHRGGIVRRGQRLIVRAHYFELSSDRA